MERNKCLFTCDVCCQFSTRAAAVLDIDITFIGPQRGAERVVSVRAVRVCKNIAFCSNQVTETNSLEKSVEIHATQCMIVLLFTQLRVFCFLFTCTLGAICGDTSNIALLVCSAEKEQEKEKIPKDPHFFNRNSFSEWHFVRRF